MRVHIFEDKTGEWIADYTVDFRGLDFRSKLQDILNQAWGAAAEDGVVDAADRARYRLEAELARVTGVH